jgi:aspartyl protease family protein
VAHPRRGFVASACLIGLAFGAHSAWSQTVSLHGVMGQQAMLVIDGQTHVVPAGRTVQGVRVLGVGGDMADVEVAGKRSRLEVGARPVQLARISGSPGGQTIVLPAGDGGHFFAQGNVNGRVVPFMVDTGATSVALSLSQAQAIGLDLKNARMGIGSTANGNVAVQVITLASVRIGDVTVHNVEAVILPMAMPYALLGNSFLSRFQMLRENDVLKLTKR